MEVENNDNEEWNSIEDNTDSNEKEDNNDNEENEIPSFDDFEASQDPYALNCLIVLRKKWWNNVVLFEL